jgi:DNA-binding YbaB/EbfC family protein
MSTDDSAPDGLSGLGGLDLGALLGQVQAMQDQMADAQAKAGSTVLQGSAGGGKVTVTVTGTGAFTAVKIDPSVVDPTEVDMLEDLVLAALRDAAAKVSDLNADLNSQSMGGLTSGLGLGDLFGS